MSPRSERRDAQAQLTRVCLREHPTSSWAAQRMSLTSHSLPGSPRLPEPRVQSWLRDGDRGPLALRGPGLLLPSDLPTSHGCSQPGPLAREFHPSCEHPPGKAKQKTPATFGEEAASPDRFFQSGEGGKRLFLRGAAAPRARDGDQSLLPGRPQGRGGRERLHLRERPAAPPGPAPGPVSVTAPPARYRHRDLLVPAALGTAARREPALAPPHRCPDSLQAALGDLLILLVLPGTNSNNTKENKQTNPTVFCADSPGC